jgi:hypothetical protein
LPEVRAVAATTRLAALVAGSLLVRVDATVAQPVVVETIALALAVRKRMAMLLVLVEAEQQLIRAAAAVAIGVVGVRLSHHNLIVVQLVGTQVAVADLVTPAPKLRLFSMSKELTLKQVGQLSRGRQHQRLLVYKQHH